MGHLRGFRAAGLAEHCQQDYPAPWGQPVGDTGLLAQQVETQFPYLPAEVPRVRLAEILGVLSQEADKESARPKSRSASFSSQDRTSGSISTRTDRSCIQCYIHLMLYARPRVRP